MGYTTDFSGSLQLSRELNEVEKNYINTFSRTRRMKRDVNKLMELYKGKHGYPFATEQTPEAIYGKDGEYFVLDDGDAGQTQDKSIIDYNVPPGLPSYNETRGMDFNTSWNLRNETIAKGECHPGLWCQWVINDDNELEWDGGEKFYEYTAWLKYLIKHFFGPWGVILNGEITWKGEDSDDLGKIVVTDNVVVEREGRITYD